MTAPTPESSEQQIAGIKENLRILENMFKLLQQGQFPGNAAQIVVECSKWVDSVHSAQSKVLSELMPAEKEPVAAEAVQGETDAKEKEA